ncbi:interleukin-1 receptor-like 1 [Sorex fumeus]|uniref:interleukin-1 receptor-like 1 n=1 Tax=Sorex fumeus TaxID=62283 RepID=UPI0024AD9CEE|nr:interleukin-1 receptor-like 1 [Sorex fumeus]
MRLQILAILTGLIPFTTASVLFTTEYKGLEKEALIVPCSRRSSRSPVEWYYTKNNTNISTQKTNRVFASGKYLKFLPAEVSDTGTYTCIVRSPTTNKTGYVNVTIYEKKPGCNVPNQLLYHLTTGSEKDSRISCPTIKMFNWTAPIEWLKNCKTLQGPRYHAHLNYLFIEDATSKDTGDYTCKFIHNENGVNYTVTATTLFKFEEKPGLIMYPEILAPAKNETKEVEIGGTIQLNCTACFGRNSWSMAVVKWYVNSSDIKNFSKARFQEGQEKYESSSNNMTCMKKDLRIVDVKEEDLLLKYECLASNVRGLRYRTIRLREKKPIDHQSTYYILTGFITLLMLIIILVIMLKVFWIEVILLWRDIIRPYKIRNDGKFYDAYVIYPRNYKSSPKRNDSVEYFVHQILPDVLENKCGYNLCIYGRDMLPGEDVAIAVENNIRKSRCHIFILTPQMLHSEEFAYEQEIALHCSLIQNDAKVILIEMEALSNSLELQFGQLQDSLQHLVKMQGTIKWKEGCIANRSSLNSKFWKHVRYRMPLPSKLPTKTSSVVMSP